MCTSVRITATTMFLRHALTDTTRTILSVAPRMVTGGRTGLSTACSLAPALGITSTTGTRPFIGAGMDRVMSTFLGSSIGSGNTTTRTTKASTGFVANTSSIGSIAMTAGSTITIEDSVGIATSAGLIAKITGSEERNGASVARDVGSAEGTAASADATRHSREVVGMSSTAAADVDMEATTAVAADVDMEATTAVAAAEAGAKW